MFRPGRAKLLISFATAFAWFLTQSTARPEGAFAGRDALLSDAFFLVVLPFSVAYAFASFFLRGFEERP